MVGISSVLHGKYSYHFLYQTADKWPINNNVKQANFRWCPMDNYVYKSGHTNRRTFLNSNDTIVVNCVAFYTQGLYMMSDK